MAMVEDDDILNIYKFKARTGEPIQWTPAQTDIIISIVDRLPPRLHIMTPTRYGKSASVAAGVVIRASLHPEKWAIVAGTRDKAGIIMQYIIEYALEDPMIRAQLALEGGDLDRLVRERSRERLTFRSKGEVRIYSADAREVRRTGESLMGFGAPNVIEDEAALIPDLLHGQVMRMLGDSPDNFLVKIGNPFYRNHFLRSYQDDRYKKIEVDYQLAISEGRFTPDFIDEMRSQPFFRVLYEVKFPEADEIDREGWSPLLSDIDIDKAIARGKEAQPFGLVIFGVDVAGGGANFSVIVSRSFNYATKVLKTTISNFLDLAGVLEVQRRDLQPKTINIDTVGIGKGFYDVVSAPFAKSMEYRTRPIKDYTVTAVNVGETAFDSERYSNTRAELYWAVRDWILKGGALSDDPDWYQLTQIKWKSDHKGKLRIMPKEIMLAQGIPSPDVADGLALSFYTSVDNLPEMEFYDIPGLLPRYTRAQDESKLWQ